MNKYQQHEKVKAKQTTTTTKNIHNANTSNYNKTIHTQKIEATKQVAAHVLLLRITDFVCVYIFFFLFVCDALDNKNIEYKNCIEQISK